MFCTICLSHSKVNTFTNGTNNYKTTTLDRHAKSKAHQTALLDKKTNHDMEKTIAAALSQKEQAVVKAMQTVYFMAKTDTANNKYQETLEWLEHMGIAELSHISSGKIYIASHNGGLPDAIANVITGSIDKRIKDNPFITILVDESTDIAVHKKLCIYARLLNKTTMSGETVFVQNVQVASGDATTTHQEIMQVMAQHNTDKRKIIGLGSDGASVSNILFVNILSVKRTVAVINIFRIYVVYVGMSLLQKRLQLHWLLTVLIIVTPFFIMLLLRISTDYNIYKIV